MQHATLQQFSELQPSTELTLDLDNLWPGDLRRLSVVELEFLAKRVREKIISTVLSVGGHFASSLGVVELSLVLHAVFETPRDKIIWDTGHQGYIHKILTGRGGQLNSIRQAEGLSGYLVRSESLYDHFGAGHAGTSISAAVGFAHAAKLAGSSESVVVVIGDGALTSGMAFEGLNHAGELKLENLIVIVNRNGESIGKNVGALHNNRTLGSFTESLGWRYLGPVDGHSVTNLRKQLLIARNSGGPLLLEVLTVKGKGYLPAERDPLKWHAVKGNNPSKVTKASAPEISISFSDLFGNLMAELAERDPRVIAITAAMPDGTGLTAAQEPLGERLVNVGIAEQHAVTYAAGLACSGLRPVVAIYSSFLQRAYDQVVHDICLQNLPVIFVLDRAGLVGEDGPTHHGLLDLAAFRAVPNLVLLAPSDGEELKGMLCEALGRAGPTLIRFPKGVAGDTSCWQEGSSYEAESFIGHSRILHEGSEALVLALGPAAHAARRVALSLETRYARSITVVDMRSVKPLDHLRLAELVPKFPLVITVEDHQRIAGFGSAVLEAINDYKIRLNGELLRLGVSDCWVPHASQEQQRTAYGLSEEGLLNLLERRIPQFYSKMHLLW